MYESWHFSRLVARFMPSIQRHDEESQSDQVANFSRSKITGELAVALCQDLVLVHAWSPLMLAAASRRRTHDRLQRGRGR